MTEAQKILWSPQPKQKILIDCPYPEVFFGGARGGGKTSGVIGKYAIKGQVYRYFNSVFFRKELPQADDLIEEAKDIYLRLGAHWSDMKKTFTFANGSRVRFRPLADDKDAEKYQGQNLTDCAVEEAGNYDSPSAILKLFGALRSKHGVPTQLILTANPGGPGQEWIYDRYIKHAPLGMRPIVETLPDGSQRTRIYIPSRVWDNQALLKINPDYISNLYSVGSEALVKAWLNGDWGVIMGAFFSEFSAQKHVIRPFAIPQRWRRIIGYDHGHHAPFAAVWCAVSDGKDDHGREMVTPDGLHIPKGTIIVYREWSAKQMPIEDIAKGILDLSQKEHISLMVGDPSMFNSLGGETVAQIFQKCGVTFQPADNDRGSGFALMRKGFRPNLDPNTKPLLYLFENCEYLIRTIRAAPIDKYKAEDLDTKSDDHGIDALRYAVKEIQIVNTDYRPPIEYATKGVIDLGAMLHAHKQKSKQVRI